MPNPFMEQLEQAAAKRPAKISDERKRAFLRGEIDTLFPEDVPPQPTPTPAPPSEDDRSWIGDVLRASWEKTAPAMAYRLATGQGPAELPELGIGGKVVSEIGGFVFDPTTYAGFGVGGLAAKGATKAAAKVLGKEALERVAAKGSLGRYGVKSIAAAPSGGAALGTMTAVKNPFEQKLYTGEFDWGEYGKAVGESAALGAGIGFVGALPRFRLPAEIGVFAVGGAALEGRWPNTDDWIMSAGVIGGLRGARVMRQALSDVTRGTPPAEIAKRARAAAGSAFAPYVERLAKTSAAKRVSKGAPVNIGPWQPVEVEKGKWAARNTETGEEIAVEVSGKRGKDAAAQVAAARNVSATPETQVAGEAPAKPIPSTIPAQRFQTMTSPGMKGWIIVDTATGERGQKVFGDQARAREVADLANEAFHSPVPPERALAKPGEPQRPKLPKPIAEEGAELARLLRKAGADREEFNDWMGDFVRAERSERAHLIENARRWVAESEAAVKPPTAEVKPEPKLKSAPEAELTKLQGLLRAEGKNERQVKAHTETYIDATPEYRQGMLALARKAVGEKAPLTAPKTPEIVSKAPEGVEVPAKTLEAVGAAPAPPKQVPEAAPRPKRERPEREAARPTPQPEPAFPPPAGLEPSVVPPKLAEAPTFKRTTPAKGTPEREALTKVSDEAGEKWADARDALEKARMERDRTRLGTKKRETLEKRVQRLSRKAEPLEKETERHREPAYKAALEDVVEGGDTANSLAARLKLKGAGEDPKLRDEYNADYERIEELARKEAKRQGMSGKEVDTVAVRAVNPILSSPGVRSLEKQVEIEKSLLDRARHEIAVAEEKKAKEVPVAKPVSRPYAAKGTLATEGIAPFTAKLPPEPKPSLKVAARMGVDIEKVRERGKEKADYEAKPKGLDAVERKDLPEDVPMWGIEKFSRKGIGKLKAFVKAVPEFKLDPTFTVMGEGAERCLQFQDGGKYKFVPKAIGFSIGNQVKAGTKIRVDPAAVLKMKAGESLFIVGKDKPKGPPPKTVEMGAGLTPPSPEQMKEVGGRLRQASEAMVSKVQKALGFKGLMPEERAERRKEKAKSKRTFGTISDTRRGAATEAVVVSHEAAKKFERVMTEGTFEEQYRIYLAFKGEFPTRSLPRDQRGTVRYYRRVQDNETRRLAAEAEAQGDPELAAKLLKNLYKYVADPIRDDPSLRAAAGRHYGSKKWRIEQDRLKRKRDKWTVEIGKEGFKFDTEAEANAFYKLALIAAKKKMLPKEYRDIKSHTEEVLIDKVQLPVIVTKRAAKHGFNETGLRKAAIRGKVKKPKPPITEEERLRSGRYERNPAVAIPRSIYETRVLTDTLRAARHTYRAFRVEVPKEYRGDKKAIDEWAELNNLEQIGEAPNLGKIAGQWVPKHIARDINVINEVPSGLYMLWRDYLNVWKASKTIWNPPTHIRNITGNIMFSDLAGASVLNPKNWLPECMGGTPIYPKAAQMLARNDPFVRRMRKRGVVGSEYFGHEVWERAGMIFRKSTTPAQKLLELARTVPGKVYNLEDQIFKVAAALKYTKYSGARNMSFGKAMREVDLCFPNYAKLPKFVKTVTRHFLGTPFLAFNVSAAQILGRHMLRQPLRVAAWYGAPGALTALSVWYLQMSDAELEMVNANRSHFDVIWFTRDKRGAPRILSLTYNYPGGNEIVELWNAELPIGEQPLISPCFDFMYNRDRFTRQPIYEDDDTPAEKWQKFKKHLYRESVPLPGATPIPGMYGYERIKNAMKGFSEETTGDAVMAALFAVNFKKPYIRRDQAYEQLKALASRDEQVAGYLTKLLKGDIRKLPYKRLVRDLEMNEAFREALEFYNEAYRSIGGPDRRVQDPITTKGIAGSLGDELWRIAVFDKRVQDLRIKQTAGDLNSGEKAELYRIGQAMPKLVGLHMKLTEATDPAVRRKMLKSILALIRKTKAAKPEPDRRGRRKPRRFPKNPFREAG